MQERSNLNVKTLNVNKKLFFKRWLDFLKPYHKLRPKEIEFLAILLYKRNILSGKVSDDSLVNKLLFDTDTRKEVREELNYNDAQTFNNMLYSLRKSNVLSSDNIIEPALIPNIKGNNFKLVFNFNVTDE